MYEFFDKSSNKGQVSRGMGPYNDYWLSFSFFPKQEAIRDIAIICPLASRSTSPPSGPGKRNPLVYFYLRVSSSSNCCDLNIYKSMRAAKENSTVGLDDVISLFPSMCLSLALFLKFSNPATLQQDLHRRVAGLASLRPLWD